MLAEFIFTTWGGGKGGGSDVHTITLFYDIFINRIKVAI